MHVGAMISRRIGAAIPTLFGVILLAFLINRVLPGDPARAVLGDQVTDDELGALRAQMGLDQPIWVQFGGYIWDILHLDFGLAWHTSRPVIDDLATRLPATIELALCAFIFSLLIGIPMGIYQAVKAGRWSDAVVRLVALAGVSIPGFWLGIQLIQLFYVGLQIAPAPSGRLGSNEATPGTITGLYLVDAILQGQWDIASSAAQHLVLPAFTLGLASLAVISRMTRSAMLDVLGRDYVRTARAKGVSPAFIIFGHVLKNAAPTIFTITALQLGYLLSGAVITESVFSWPGIGSYIYQSILASDYAPVQAVMVLTAGFFIAVNLFADVAQVIVDPKTRAA